MSVVEHLASWGWPQWIALAALLGKAALAVRDIGRESSGAPVSDKNAAQVYATMLWAALLAAGGFWS